MWKRIWNKAEKEQALEAWQVPWRWWTKDFSLLPLEGGGAKRRRLAHTLYWQNRINEFLQSVRFLNDHGIGLWGTMRSLYVLHGAMQGEHLWFSPPRCFLTCPLCRSFPSTYHSFFSSLFFLEKHHIDVMQASIWCFLLFSIQEWSKMKKWLNGNWLTVWI